MVLNGKNFNPLFESDPDIQFYNEFSTMYIDNSIYYFEDRPVKTNAFGINDG